jgi:predicted transcriptional regulator
VGSINVTVRFSEEELQRLDELARRMNKTRSDIIRELIAKFDETLREEVEKERRKWMAIGFVGALESAILDPEVVMKFVRRNVDILGFPDFLVGMVRVRNRVVLFSHHDRTGSQLLQLIRSRIEEEIRREEAELMQEDDGDGDSEGGRAMPVRIRASKPVRPNTIRVAPVPSKYKLLINNKATPPIARPTATSAVGRHASNGGGSGAKAAVAVSVSKNQKSGSTGIPTTHNSATTQAEGPSPQVNTNAGGVDLAGPNGQAPTDRPVGDFAFALVVNLYHKRRESLLRFIEALTGG